MLEKRIRVLSKLKETADGVINRLGWARVAIFVFIVVSIPLIWYRPTTGWVLAGISALSFVILSVCHQRLEKTVARIDAYIKLRSNQRAQIELDWDKLPNRQDFIAPKDHLYFTDLDIGGDRSLLHLINVSATVEGGARLGRWLCGESLNHDDISARQKLVTELRALPGFRDRLLTSYYLTSDRQVQAGVFLSGLRQTEAMAGLTKYLVGLSVLLLAMWGGALLEAVGVNIIGLNNFWLYALSLYALTYYTGQKHLNHVMQDIVHLEDSFKHFEQITPHLEDYPYTSNSALADLCAPFLNNNRKPSAQVRKLRRLIGALTIRMNWVAGIVLNLIFPWDYFFAWRLDIAKRGLRDVVPIWIEVWTELEALCSLANYAWLHPDTTLPEIIDDKPLTLEATDLGHPLIASKACVKNNVQLHEDSPVYLITGSNMSGKSTYLKAIGLNLALAYAGAPVFASHMRTSLFRLHACIKVTDFVTDGFSYFYAEVRRLKQILDAIQQQNAVPVLYLIDEIFKGTNNRERFYGSRSYIRALVKLHALGAVSTHDLELTSLAKELDGIRNVHFKEHIEAGQMKFDYLLREGPSPTTNALKIMQLEGLPVEEPGSE